MSRIRNKRHLSHTKGEQNPFSVFFNGLVIIAAVCLIIVIMKRSATQVLDQASTDTKSSFEWKLPPPPRKLGVTNLPGTPQIREVLKSHNTNAVAGYDPESLSLKFRTLVENHPISMIRNELHERLKAKTIFLNWQAAPGLLAQFHIVSSGTTHMLVLSLNPEWLASVQTSDQIYLAFLVIFHEYVHVQQYDLGNEKVKLYFASSHVPESELQITKEDICRQMWFTEHDAYTQECRIANQWGYPLMETFCLYVDSPAWSHVIFNRLYKDAYLEEKVKRVCGPIFAKLAGHPHPELF